MKIIIGLMLLLVSTGVFGSVYVQGYYRSDGKYVQGHYRSNPDNSTYNNYSTKGNVNPYKEKKESKSNIYNQSLSERFKNNY